MTRQKDAGWAWVCVVGSFYIHFIVIGLMQSFGVIYVELLDQFNSSRGETAWIGSLLSGLVLLLGPVGVVVLDLLGTRVTAILGAVLACVGCSVSFLAESLIFLYFSYGVIQGLGFNLMFITATVIVNQYFVKRRSLANALGSLGGGVGTLVLPPLLQVMMSEYTWRGALLITGGLVLNCAVFGTLFKPFYSKQELSDLKTETRKSGIWLYVHPVAVADIVGDEKLTEGLGCLFFLEGVVIFLGSPTAGWLYDATGDYAISFYAAGSLFIVGGAVILLYEVTHTCKQLRRHNTTKGRADNTGGVTEELLR
ncbi:monocarboxylate transporter 14-like [Haliotis rubra]|uniref:monocarboxylate transporter 14-like n=1 Tax=Haliotis rubra TaxID=36100 RepID=UPI001EE5A36E|nr:monocarboxylate transporter 14-like [Haliotis rubra]